MTALIAEATDEDGWMDVRDLEGIPTKDKLWQYLARLYGPNLSACSTVGQRTFQKKIGLTRFTFSDGPTVNPYFF